MAGNLYTDFDSDLVFHLYKELVLGLNFDEDMNFYDDELLKELISISSISYLNLYVGKHLKE